MEFTSVSFLLFIAGVVVLANLHPHPAYRKIILGLASAFFIGCYVTKPEQVIPLIGFLILGYALMEMLRHARSVRALWGALAVILTVFVYFKRYAFFSFVPTLPFAYLIIGLSYILFRMIHLIVLAHSGELPVKPGLLSYFNYTCNFLSFVSGPIQQYPPYLESESKTTNFNEDVVYRSFARIILGYSKLVVVSAVADYLFQNWSTQILSAAVPVTTQNFMLDYALAVVSYTAYLYYNFSGYMDIVIGIGWLVGQDLPENFNKPFAARSFLEFWTRWHMTLSEWFKIYVFNPLLQALVERIDSARAMTALGIFTFFVTFLIMGIWHGPTLVFIVYGLLMGLGASLNKLWQVAMAGWFGKKKYKLITENPVYARLSRGLTFAYFSLAVTCLWVTMDQLTDIAHHLRPQGIAAVVVGLTLAAAAGALLWDAMSYAAARAVKTVAALRENFAARNLWLAAHILFILTVMSFFHKSPEFVYKAF